jgi:pimeloyl-ACP methyl ester carboxylesterase
MSSTTYAASTARTQYAETKSARFAYRRLGPVGGVPLLLLHRFRATIDWWDPRFIEALAAERDVILFDNIGIGDTEGAPMNTVEAYVSGAVAFIEALGLPQVDLLGWSFGGVVAQGIVLQRPDLIRRLIVAGSGSGSAPGMPAMGERVANIMLKPKSDLEDVLYLFYPEKDAARAKGVEHFSKIAAGMPQNAPVVTQEAAMGQLAAITATLAAPWEQVAGRGQPAEDHAAGAVRQWRSRRHDRCIRLVRGGSGTAERQARPVQRRRTRLPVPAPRHVRA